MASAFQRLFGDKKNSKETAKERLQLVLIHDRASLSKGIVDDLKKDLIAVISKYMEIDAEGLDIQITQTESEGNNGNVPALFANIPIKDMRHTSASD